MLLFWFRLQSLLLPFDILSLKLSDLFNRVSFYFLASLLQFFLLFFFQGMQNCFLVFFCHELVSSLFAND